MKTKLQFGFMPSIARVVRVGWGVVLLLAMVGHAQAQDNGADALKRLWVVGDAQDEQNVVFGQVNALAFHPEAGLHVLDTSLNAIHRYDDTGQRLGAIEYLEGQGPGELFQPLDLAVAGDGAVFVVDRQQQRVAQFDAEGAFVQQHAVSFTPTRIAAGDDALFITSFWLTSDTTLYVSARDGTDRRGLRTRPSEWRRTAMTGNVERIRMTPDGTLLYALPHPYRLVELRPDGTVRREATGQPAFATITEGERVTRLVEGTRGLAILDDGRVAVLVTNREAERAYLDLFSRDLVFAERIDLTEALPSMPRPYLASGPGTTLFFAFSEPYHRVAAYDLLR